MLYEIITGNHLKETDKYFFYEIHFLTEKIKISFPYPLDENSIFILNNVLGAKKIIKYNNINIKEPIKKGGIILEKNGYDFIIKKIGGKDNPDINTILTKINKNFFPITLLKKILTIDEIQEMIHFMISKKYFSYQVLYTLSNIIEFALKTNLSERIYLDLMQDIKDIKENLDTDKKWKIIALFISNYQFNEFIKIKNKIPYFTIEGNLIKKYFAESFLEYKSIVEIIIENIKDNVDIQLFLVKINDDFLARGLSPEEIKIIKNFISKRKLKKLEEDINIFYNKNNSWEYKVLIIRELINYLIEKSPEFYLINQLYNFSEYANNLFDLIGPFRSAVFLKTYPDKSFINNLSPIKKGFIEAFINGKIRKIGGITNKEIKEAVYYFKFYLISINLFKNIYSIL
ncbi:MAG TPA: hypothetical protein PKW55_01680 [Spirochaetota bacterium]|nr:hypothetical protein [Spirochaetota bacterium]HOM38995.1 hypothetical protein [Spirochaetota bacterium]HPQ48346.1 hypothetical protein [Spirochaetota bacterium]